MAQPYLTVITGVVIATYTATPSVIGQRGSSVTVRTSTQGDIVLAAIGAEAEAAGAFLRTGESVAVMAVLGLAPPRLLRIGTVDAVRPGLTLEQIDELVFGKWDALLGRLGG